MSHIEVVSGTGVRLICAHCPMGADARPFVVLTTTTQRDKALAQLRLHHLLKHARSRSEQRVAKAPLAA